MSEQTSPKRCEARSPGGRSEDGRLPRKGTRCGNYEGHDGPHTVLIPTDAPWFTRLMKRLGEGR
jgi:hypothetical protein